MAKTITGKVVQAKNDKTITILTHFRKSHPIYKKQYTISKKYMAHDPKNSANIGDQVIISETKPISKRKHFILDKIVQKAQIKEETLEIIKENPSETKKVAKEKPKEEDK